MNFYGTTVGPQHTLVGRIAPLCEAFQLAVGRAAAQPSFQPRYAHTLPDWGHNIANELTKTIFKGLVRVAPIENQTSETQAGKNGQILGLFIRVAIFYWKEAPAQIERDGLSQLTKTQEEKLEKVAGWELLLPHASELAGRPITKRSDLLKFHRGRYYNFLSQIIRANLRLINQILHQPIEEIFQFLNGIPKGFKSFLKTDGDFAGKGKRTELFLALLTYWPEIEEMRLSEPARNRKYLLDWLEKQEGKQLVADDKIFFELCHDVGLDLALPGHPFKALQV